MLLSLCCLCHISLTVVKDVGGADVTCGLSHLDEETHLSKETRWPHAFLFLLTKTSVGQKNAPTGGCGLH